MNLHVDSEVGRLRQTILHRPDLELKRLTPTNKDEYLFDDVLWVKRAKQEHDGFAESLRDLDVKVYLLDQLLRETVAIPEARKYILDASLDEMVYGPMAIDALYNTATYWRSALAWSSRTSATSPRTPSSARTA